MSAPQFLQTARDLDRDIAFLDALLDTALTTGAHPRIRLRLLVLRNQNSQKWGAAVGTSPVERRAVLRT